MNEQTAPEGGSPTYGARNLTSGLGRPVRTPALVIKIAPGVAR